MAKPADDLAGCVQALQDILREPHRAAEIAEAALAAIMCARMGVTAAPEGRVSVRIPDAAHGWAKWVLAVDLSAKGGFMFEGPFLPLGKPSPILPGAVVIVANGGIKKTPTSHVLTAWIVQPDGALGGNPQTQPRAGWPDLAKTIDFLSQQAAQPAADHGAPIMNAMNWFRFLNTPGELWARIAAWIVGARVEYHAIDEHRFDLAINTSGTKLRLRINAETMEFDKAQASALTDALIAAVAEMKDRV